MGFGVVNLKLMNIEEIYLEAEADIDRCKDKQEIEKSNSD